jgi:hypothetical protein
MKTKGKLTRSDSKKTMPNVYMIGENLNDSVDLVSSEDEGER